MLPVELWKNIALQYTVNGIRLPAVYCILSLVSRAFIIDTPILQEYYLTHTITHDITEYRLPNKRLHSPGFGRQPASVDANSIARRWLKNGEHHRTGGLPSVITSHGDQYWYIDGRLHRSEDKPAVMEVSGNREWYIDGRRHRDNNLPAIITAHGDRYWYIAGDYIKYQHTYYDACWKRMAKNNR